MKHVRALSAVLVAISIVSLVACRPMKPPAPASWTSPQLDGMIHSRPVIVGNVVVVATLNDSLYGLAISDGHVLWGPTRVGTPEPLSAIRQLGAPCGNIDPLGILSNLVIGDNGTVFAVAERQKQPVTNPPRPEHVLVGVNPANGAIAVGPRVINPPGMNVPAQQQRAGLAAANGNVYVGFGGLDGDCGDYHGWVVAAKQDGTGIAGFFEVATTGAGNYAGAVWATGGIVVGAQGNVFAATGNSFNPPPSPNTDYSDAVLKLSPTAGLLDYFQPSNWRTDDAADLDLGSAAPVLVQGPLVFQLGKQRAAFLLNGFALGGANHNTPVAHLDDVCTSLGGDAYQEPSVYVACTSGAQQVIINRNANPPTLVPGWTAPVRANGPVTLGTNVVWSVDTSGHVLYALDTGDGHVVAQHPINLDSSQHFPTPVVAGGRVLVEAGRSVVAFAT